MKYKDQAFPLKVLLVWTHEGSEHFAKWLNNWKFDPLVVTPIFMLLFIMVALSIDPAAVYAVLEGTIFIGPVWVPIFFFVLFWVTWMRYIRFAFWFKQEHLLLEIQLPPEVEKSPAAMELFLITLWNAGGEATFITRIWKGQFRPVWSLEIASNEGRISYYLHLRKNWKSIVEARLYGQFPESKVTEVEDYVSKVSFNLDEYDLFGAEYEKSAPSALPIKSYIDYELDKSPDKPEIQVDPITNLLELLGQIGKDEYFWMQIIMKARKKDEWYGFYTDPDKYKEEAKKAIEDIFEGAVKRTERRVKDPVAAKAVASRGVQLLSDSEKKRVEAVEHSLTKLIFECGIRVVYLAKRASFNGTNSGGLIQFFNAYRYPDFNSLGPFGGTAYFDYPWQDFRDIRKSTEKRHLFAHYKERAYFYVPYDQKPLFMTTGELATIWHFPNSLVKTPGLSRVPSRRSEAPPNLPIGPGVLK